MSPMLSSSQGVVLATAMAAALSATFLLFSIKSHKSSSLFHPNSLPVLRPCLSSGEKKGDRKKTKRVRFAKDVVEPTSNGELFRRLHGGCHGGATSQRRRMPANRVALYHGLLRDRVVHRVAYMY